MASLSVLVVAFLAIVAPPVSVQQGVDEIAMIRQVLARHAGLRAARGRLRVAKERFKLEWELRAPRLGLQIMSPPGLNGSQIAMMQPFERQERRQWAARLASAEEKEAQVEVARIAAGIRQAVRTLVAEEKFTESALRLIDRAQSRTRAMARLASTRYSVGKAAQSEIAQVQLRQTGLLHDRIMREEALATVAAKLGTLVDGDPGRQPCADAAETPPIVGPPLPQATRPSLGGNQPMRRHIDLGPELPALKNLVATGEQHAPDLLARQAATLRAQSDLELARLAIEEPDVDFGLMFGKSQDMGDPMFGVSLSLDLPFLRSSRLELARTAAAQALEAARATAAQARLDLLERIALSRIRIAALDSQIRLHVEVLSPQTELAARTAEVAYLAGQVPFSDLLERQADLDGVELSEQRLIADRKHAEAELEAVIGVPLAEIDR